MSTIENEKAVEFLESCVKNYKIFMDTCSFLFEKAEEFWSHIIPILQREKKTIIVPNRVYEEVNKFATRPDLCEKSSDLKLNERAKKAEQNICILQRAGLIEIFKGDADNFADNVFQTVFTNFRLKYNLLLITQDRNLSSDIVSINNSKAVKTKNCIMVARINRHGYLSKFRMEESNQPEKESGSASSRRRSSSLPESECFAKAFTVKAVRGTMSVSEIPLEGSVLTAKRGNTEKSIRLTKKGPSGGEGTIYFTDIPNMVAKIYKPEKLDRAKYEKLKLMISKSIDCEGICFPEALLFNTHGEFVGYLMKQAKGKELQRCVFIPQLLEKNFPSWNKKDTVTLCVTILKKLKYLHDRNIILGDINPNNILIVSPTEVYFVDTDSYQVEGYPCPVGTVNYTAPEIQRKNFPEFLRTQGNEQFAVATLLFMIMLPGKPPYSLQGGENQIDNIINGEFAYALGEKSSGKAPDGRWRFCWSHLPYYLKEDFYETFRKGGKHSTEATRYSTDVWLAKFEHYLGLLESGKLTEQDPMSLEIIPTRLKKNPYATYIRCRLCGNETEENKAKQQICPDCLKKGESYYCIKCGQPMVYTNYQKYILQAQKHEICKDCLDKRNAVYTSIRCLDCGSYFNITFGEKEFYEKKGFQLPKKCKNCRGQRNYSPTPSYPSYPTNNNTPYTPKKNGSFCFITTAACEYFGKADNCYELETLRSFRDGWLVLQPGGEEIIREYYRVAPPIVEALNASTDRDKKYKAIWDSYILPCVQLIEQGSYESCRKLYEKMVNSLKCSVLKED